MVRQISSVISLSFLLVLSSFLASSCASDTGGENPGDGGDQGNSSLTVRLPSSVSWASQSGAFTSRAVSSEVAGDLRDIYDIVREFAAISEELGHEIGELLLDLEKELPGFAQTYTVDIDEGDQSFRFQFGPGGDSYEKHFSAWALNMPGVTEGEKIVEAYWNGDFQSEDIIADGYVLMSGAFLEIPNSVRLRLDFDTANETFGKWMRVRASNMTDAGEDMDALDMTASSSGSEVALSANLYIPGSESWSDGLISDERNFVFSAAADSSQNLGVIKVAAVPSAETGNDPDNIYGNYSLGDIYQSAMLEFINDSTPGSEGQSIRESLAGFGLLSDSNPDVTLEEMVDVVNNSALDGESEVQGIRFAFAMENPVYTDAQGYIANGLDNQPATHSASLVERAGLHELVSPAAVKAMELAFVNPDMPATTSGN